LKSGSNESIYVPQYSHVTKHRYLTGSHDRGHRGADHLFQNAIRAGSKDGDNRADRDDADVATTQPAHVDSGLVTNPRVVCCHASRSTQQVAAVPTPVSTPVPKDDTVPVVKPLPEMERDYATATNRDVRLDIIMDIAELPGAESVRSLTRLFEIETDMDLKVDLLDSLLGIDGHKEEKLIMLTLGTRQGLPGEIRQSAIDGLIDWMINV